MLYPARNATAYSVQKLLNGGAQLLGKTKTSQFAFKEDPTADWVDVHAPSNVRGDGYNSATSSSAGSGAAIVAYDFLDFAVGSDTGGSVRSPAAACGAYGIRPCHGYLSLEGVVPQAGSMETPGIFARDPSVFTTVSRYWYGNEGLREGPFSMPSTITRLVDYTATPAATEIIDKFLDQMGQALSMNIAYVNLTDTWANTSDVSESVNDYMLDVFGTLTGYFSHTQVGEPFFSDYAAAHNGSTPFVNPQVRTGWDYGVNQTQSGYEDRLSRKQTFKDFYTSSIVQANNDTCSSSIVVFPYMGVGVPNPRDTYLAGPYPLNAFLQTFLAPYVEAPEIVLPLGQVEVPSSHNGGTQLLPVTVNIQAYPGCDFLLFDVIDALVEQGLLGAVNTGSVTS